VISGTPVKSDKEFKNEMKYFRHLIHIATGESEESQKMKADIRDWLRGKFLFHKLEVMQAQIQLPRFVKKIYCFVNLTNFECLD
jgi:hypothetical protein